LVNVQVPEKTLELLEQNPSHAILLNASDIHRLLAMAKPLISGANDVPIIGCAIPRNMARAVALGAIRHLVKPVTRADLASAIQHAGQSVRHVLVVDDDPDACQLFSRMLTTCDATLDVATASSADEALEILRRNPPDLMLLDIFLPGADGWHVLESMARDMTIKHVPTYVVSSQDPLDRLATSPFLLVMLDGGISFSKILRCSLELSQLLREPEGAPDPAHG
jgi:CheY-like chemotaxis protein